MTYTLLIDTLRDTSFGGVYDDITAYLLEANWNAGMSSAYEEVAPPSQLQLTLRNIGGEFDPESLGDELLVNPSFDDWAGGNPDNWPVTGESGSDPEVSEVGAALLHGGGGTGNCNLYTTSAALSISQAVLTSGTRYKVVLVIGAVDGTGGVVIKNNGAAVSAVYHTAGTKTVYFTAAATDFTIETDGAANVTLDSASAKATSRYAGALIRGTLVRLKYGAVVLYEGKIDTVLPMMGDYTARAVQVTVQDAMLPLLKTDYSQTLLTNTTIDTALDDLFDKAVIAYPYAHRYWLLGVEGASELDNTTTLYTHTATDFDTGSTTLDYIGDNLDRGQGVNAQTVIRELMATEFGGRFWWNARAGKFFFDSRTRDVLDITNDANYTASEFNQVTTAYGDDLANEILIDCESRELGTPGTVIWRDTSVPFLVRPGETKEITARYRDPDNEAISMGATDVLNLARFVDIIGNQAQDGSGIDMTHYIQWSVDAGGASATIKLWTLGHRSGVYITTLQLKGTPLRRFPRETVTARDGDSFRATDYKIEKQISIPALGDKDTAEAGANFLLGKYKTPVMYIKQVTRQESDGSASLAATMGRAINDRIGISDSTTGHDADYFIVGEQHRLQAGEWNVHDVTWVLKPASREVFWLLEVAGYSELDMTTRLAF